MLMCRMSGEYLGIFDCCVRFLSSQVIRREKPAESIMDKRANIHILGRKYGNAL